jgi:hypothetical protein
MLKTPQEEEKKACQLGGTSGQENHRVLDSLGFLFCLICPSLGTEEARNLKMPRDAGKKCPAKPTPKQRTRKRRSSKTTFRK